MKETAQPTRSHCHAQATTLEHAQNVTTIGMPQTLPERHGTKQNTPHPLDHYGAYASPIPNGIKNPLTPLIIAQNPKANHVNLLMSPVLPLSNPPIKRPTNSP